MDDREQRVIIRWRTRIRSEALTPALDRAYPPLGVADFDDVLKAIDQAETQIWGGSDPTDEPD